MNERIEKLIEQCTVQEFSDCTGGFETFDKVKFAELIVQECILVIEEEAEHIHAEGTIEAIVNLEKHFGVE